MAALSNISLYSSPACAIFFNDDIGSQTRACDRIGAIWTGLRQTQNRADKIALMTELGVCATDRDAHRDLLPLLQIIFTKNIKIIPSVDNSGVYFLSCGRDKFAVFKVGEKRARTELLARKIAHRAGLEKHAIPGMACTLQYPRFRSGEPVQVELFNGNVAVYSNDDQQTGNYNKEVRNQNDHMKTPYTVTGILEPYIKENQPVNFIEDFAGIVTFALLIGLRDGKLDGMLNGKLFDLEDIMPARMIPEQESALNVAATHLPLLKHPLAQAPIPIAILQKLLFLVSEDSFSLSDLEIELAHEWVGIADLAAESLTLPGKMPDDELGHMGWSDGGCPIQVEPATQIMDEYPIVEVNDQNARLLTDAQIGTFSYRVSQLRIALERSSKSGSVSPIDLVFAVDPLYEIHWNAFEDFDRLPLAEVVGVTTPKARLSPEAEQQLRKAKEKEIQSLTFVRARSCPPPNTSS